MFNDDLIESFIAYLGVDPKTIDAGTMECLRGLVAEWRGSVVDWALDAKDKGVRRADDRLERAV
jgi:hypothetical protein